MVAAAGLIPAYVLHTRAFRDTSLIAELFTRDRGKVGVVARGARRQTRHGVARFAELRPLTAIAISLGGRGELRTLRHCEGVRALRLTGEALYGGLYTNELLMRLLARDDAHPALFDAYQQLLEGMAQLSDSAPHAARAGGDDSASLAELLREFELMMLRELGYGFNWAEFRDDCSYCYRVEEGLVAYEAHSAQVAEEDTFDGATLRAIARCDYRERDTLRVARRLTRLALAPLLGDRPLRTPGLLRAANRPRTGSMS